MRVLYVLRYYPTLTETFVYNEIDAIRLMYPQTAIEIAALGTRSDGATQDRLPSVPVHRVPRRPLVGRLQRSSAGLRWLRAHQRPKDAARLPWLAARLDGIDHIHVHFAGEAAEWAHALWLDRGIPYTVMVHAVDLFRPRPSLSAVLSGAHAVLTIAGHHVQRLSVLGITARLVRCGPSLEAFAAPDPPAPGPLRGLFVGRNVPKKGLDTLLAAWAGAPPGARLEVISTLSGPAPPGVTVLGPQPSSAVRAALWRSNVTILPCRQAPDGDLDGVPVVLMESLAAGRPVITTPISGIPELVDDGVGWLVPPGDAAALREALVAASDPTVRAARGAAGPGQLRARGFTLRRQAAGVHHSWHAVAD